MILPPYAFVPGGPWPHPTRSPDGHSFGGRRGDAGVAPLLEGIALFNAGYYWEAHEAWESHWHALGRRGAEADLVKGLIKLAAAGVKVRERQPHGVVTHATRAAALFERVRNERGPRCEGLDIEALRAHAMAIAEAPLTDPAPAGARVSIVFPVRIEIREPAPDP
jgi:hypothetical protein